MYNRVCVRNLVISRAHVLIIVISQLPSVGVRVSITDNGEAGDNDLFSMNNFWAVRNRGCGWVFLFFRL